MSGQLVHVHGSSTPGVQKPAEHEIPAAYIPLPVIDYKLIFGLMLILVVDRVINWSVQVVFKLLNRGHVFYDPISRVLLSRLLERSSAARASIALFHNGTSSFSGNQFIRFSLFHEVTRPPIESVFTKIQNVLINAAHQEFSDCLEDKDGIAAYTYNPADEGCARFLDRIGMKCSAYFLLRDKARNPVGFVGLFFTDPYTDLQLNEIVRSQSVRSLVSQIEESLVASKRTAWTLLRQVQRLFGV